MRIDAAQVHATIGEAHMKCGAWKEAVDDFNAALALNPFDLRSLRLLCGALEVLGDKDEAVGAWCSLGNVLERSGDLEGAAKCFHRALTFKSDCIRALVRLSGIETKIGDPRDVKRLCEAVLAIQPAHKVARLRRGWACDCLGELEQAWEGFSAYYTGPFAREFEQPLWTGEPLAGKTILLWVDLGLGDAIRDIRFAKTVKRLGAKVIVEAPHGLISLFQQYPYLDRVIRRGVPLPSFDVHAPLIALPRALRIRLDTIPSDMPYLSAPEERRSHWARRLGSAPGRRVGLVWASDQGREHGRLKSVPLAMFGPLAAVRDTRFVSLQFGPRVSDLLAPPPGLRLEEYLSPVCDIGDTAAIMHNLDLIISVDTMTAHLAGALAKPTWVLVPGAHASWLWHRNGHFSRWYPTMRLFCQRRGQTWTEVVAAVATALTKRAG